MKKLIYFLMALALFLPSSVYPVDIKISELPTATSLVSTDILPVVVDMGTTPVTKKITFGNMSISLGMSAGTDGDYGVSLGNNTSTFAPTGSYTYGYSFIGGKPYAYFGSANHQLLEKTQVFNQCTTVKGLVATDDFPVAIFPYAITITAVRIYHIGSTDVQGQFDECTGTNGVCTSLTAVDADIDASSASVWTADDGSLSNPSIAANNGIWWHTTSVTGTNTFATMCFYYTID